MSAADTKARILAAAGRVFAARGLAGFSVRAVTTEAGTNIAAVSYHFGSKGGLLRALMRQVFGAVTIGQGQALDRLLSDGSAPTVEAIVATYAAPVFTLFDGERAGEWGRAWVAAREVDGPEREPPPMQFSDNAVTRRFHEALRQALPAVPPDEL